MTSNYTYETKTDGSGSLTTALISLGTPTIEYLWGLSEFSSTESGKKYGCPIGVYMSKDKFVWNKVTIKWTPAKAFPSGNKYYLVMLTEGADSISEASI